MRELNGRYRGIDRTTDVLSFSQREGPPQPHATGLLGDVVISVEQAARQAPGAKLEAEILRLLVHGLCHLRGLDHGDHNKAAVMQAEERRLLSVVGL